MASDSAYFIEFGGQLQRKAVTGSAAVQRLRNPRGLREERRQRCATRGG